MPADDLNAPLGQDKDKPASKPLGRAPQALAGLLGLLGIAVVGWALFVNDPLGGEPVVTVATVADPAAPVKADDAADANHPARYDGPAVPGAPPANANITKPADKTASEPAPGTKTVTIIDGSTGKRKDIVLPDHDAAPLAQPADKKMLEPTTHGAIPQIAPDGTRAFALYARPRTLPANRGDAPRIAIVVGGLGISASATAEALAKLPAAVTFAIAPYGAGLDRLATSARERGHELLLQIPMEPFDYPNNDPGPRTLLTSLAPEENIDRLHWLMARFQGYVGLIGYMGAKFTASEQALTPILHDAAKRGLLYVDDGSSLRSNAGQIAGGSNMPFAKADIVLDAVPTPVEIDRALARLELAAREHGVAVGYANAQPGSIARIAEWAKAVEERGFVLVPVTMVAVKAKST